LKQESNSLTVLLIVLVIINTVISTITLIMLMTSQQSGASRENTATSTQQTPYYPYYPGSSSIIVVSAQQFIQVQDAVFYMQRSTDGTKMSITLTLNIKNQADRSVTITKIAVPDLNWEQNITDVSLRPGDTWTQIFVVAQNIAYSPSWESGNEHTIVIYFKVYGETMERNINISAGVRG